ncbi:hypothetical protein CC80DRAFT_506531 [Byssothecium circinans]|uniref:Uncharacterized protein n=1 Tax=Byssothecium circinans TaxID=147558 RepID=A0A6A5TR13_9PLEO|nr:hypothetical protein CC80DRAFT_506531 [Byssothecium circinans]
MPRPNRYHPYKNQPTSPRYPAARSLAKVLHPMPAIAEQPLVQPYQHIRPGYIRGVTEDGRALTVRSICQTADGLFHVQMEAVRFPSEDVKCYNGTYQSAIPSPPMMQQTDPTFSSLGIKRETQPYKGSGSESSQDGRSIRSVSEECAITTDDEDAEGDVDEEHCQAVAEQARIIANLRARKNAMGFGQ